MDILEGLNNEQRAAVCHDEGPLLVVAGAGTGKTQVITRRIAYLIREHKVAPHQILALTFTEKAAREMEDRLYGLAGWESFQVPVMTFNAFGAELLGRYASHIGRSTRGGLITQNQKTLLLQQHFNEVELKYYGVQSNLFEFLERIVAYIEKLQNAGVSVERYLSYVNELTVNQELHPSDILEQEDLVTLYELYESVKLRTGTYDYYDQLALPLQILTERPNLAERLAREYRYVLVDEYQDTSPVQDQLLRSFVSANGNIFAVGDDDQAIYSFRGANLDNILSFAEHFEVKDPVVLVKNYRSGQPILDAAYRLICHNNPDRLEAKLGLIKRLVAATSAASLDFRAYNKPTDEYAGVVEAIKKRLADGASAQDIGVLARSNAVLKSLAKILEKYGIPYSLSTEVDVFSQTEIKSLWYFLQWIGELAENESISHILMGPLFNWSSDRCREMTIIVKREMVQPEESLRQMAAGNDEAAKSVIEALDLWRQEAIKVPVSQLLYRIVFEGGLADRLRQEGSTNPRVLAVFEDLHRLLSQMQDFESIAESPVLASYLQVFPKPPRLQMTEKIGSESGVQLLTVHASKGLEFETVYLLSCTQRSWSEQAHGGLKVPEALTQPSEFAPIHEQRRLLYVAATRAKRNLIVSAAQFTSGGQTQALSPLVSELLPESVPTRPKPEKGSKTDTLIQRLQQFYPLKDAAASRSLPFEDSNGWIDLGISALQQYDDCPYDFFLQHVLGIREPFGTPMAFGSVIHQLIQTYYEGRMRGEVVELAELQQRLDELWHDKGYETREQSEADRKRAWLALEWFVGREQSLEVEQPNERRLLGTETKINLELPDAKLRLRGRIDAYFQTPDGIEIRDFKTGRGKTDPEKLTLAAKQSFQLRTYALAYLMGNGVAPAKVTLDYVVTRTEGSANLSERILANHRDKLAGLAARIRERDFAPAPPSQFHQCAANKFYGEDDDDLAAVSGMVAV